MKSSILIILFLIFSVASSFSQVAINSTGNQPNAKAMLDVSSTTSGILIPRMTSTERTNISPGATEDGLTVYDTDTKSFWFYDGSAWVEMSKGGEGWLLTGNSGTTAGTNFLGTTDNQALDIRTNNTLFWRFTTHGQIETYNTGRSIFIGEGAGANDDLSWNGNVFLGYGAGRSNTSGENNIAIGYASLYNATTVSGITAIGANSLYSNTGEANTAVGYCSLEDNTSGTENTAVGYNSLADNTTGTLNTALGVSALSSNTDTHGSTAIGAYALQKNTGSENTAVGARALDDNTSGNYNVAIGTTALSANQTGNQNTAVGWAALYSCTASSNSAFGYGALQDNTSGDRNTAVGYLASNNNTTGGSNVAMGDLALYSNTTGSHNTAVGDYALVNGDGSDYNTAYGYNALSYTTSGHDNVGIGPKTISNNRTGSYNTAIGSHAGDDGSTTDHSYYNTTLLGAYSLATASNSTAIGYRSYVTQSNSLVLGSIDGENGATATTNVGIGTSAPAHRLDIVGDDGTTEDVVLQDNGGSYSYLHFVIRNTTGSGTMSYSFSQQSGNYHFAGIDLETSDEGLIIRNNYCTDNGFSNGYIGFETRIPSQGTGERMRLTNEGYLGIGTTSPRSILHVRSPNLGANDATITLGPVGGAGSSTSEFSLIDFWSTFDNYSADQGPRRTASIKAYYSGGTWGNEKLSFYVGRNSGNNDAGVIPDERVRLQNGTTQLVGNSWGSLSDKRLKSNINDIPYGLNEIMRIKPVIYDMHYTSTFDYDPSKISDKTYEDIGFIAQDLYQVIPDVVAKPQGNEYWAIKYEKLTPVLVKGMQEQQAEIEKLQNTVEQQQQTIEQLQRTVKQMQQQIQEIKNNK